MKKTTTKAQRIRACLSVNPNATAKEVASACNATLTNVYQVRHAMKKETKPPRTYRKKTITKKVEPKVLKVKKKEFEFVPQDKPRNLVNEVLVTENAQLNIKVRNLEHQIVGYRAVIDFLEWQLNLRRTNHGATV
jgi:ABC-type lipoprotein export system ATPase subunit